MTTAAEANGQILQNRPTIPARALRMFVILTLVLAAGYVVHASGEQPNNLTYFAITAAIFAGASIVLAVLAKVTWGMRAPTGVRVVLTAVLAYHALFGPAMLVQQIRSSTDGNEDFVQHAWPHVVAAINSLE